MSDSVNRELVLGYIDYVRVIGLGKKKALEYVRKYVQHLPAEIPQWIPCSERLPREGESVLVTEKWHGHVWMWRLQYIDNEPTWEVDGYNVDIDEAIAWMPLPMRWKGADDECR